MTQLALQQNSVFVADGKVVADASQAYNESSKRITNETSASESISPQAKGKQPILVSRRAPQPRSPFAAHRNVGRRGKDFDKYLLVWSHKLEGRTVIDALDYRSGEMFSWSRLQAGVEIGSRLVNGWALITWDAIQVLNSTANLKRIEGANFFQYRYQSRPNSFDVYALPNNNPPLDTYLFWGKAVRRDMAPEGVIDSVEFERSLGRPIYSLKPVAMVLTGAAAEDLERTGPQSLSDLRLRLESLTTRWRAIFTSGGETIATMLENVAGTASLTKRLFRKAGLRRQALGSEALQLGSEEDGEGDTESRSFFGWPIEEAMQGALIEISSLTLGIPLRHYSMLDEKSMYCHVALLMDLWPLQSAQWILSARLLGEDLHAWQRWIRTLDYKAISPRNCPDVWPQLRGFCRVSLREGDTLVQSYVQDGEVRSNLIYFRGPGRLERIVAMPDVLLSYLWTGQMPDVLEALCVSPGPQQKLEPVSVFGQSLDLKSTNPYSYFVDRKEHAKDGDERYFWKLNAVAAYGVTGEAHASTRPDYGKGYRPAKGDDWDEAGVLYCPAVAALTTAGARLLLGAQTIAAGGLGYGGCASIHTDSLIVPDHVASALIEWDTPGWLRYVEGSCNGPLQDVTFMVWGKGRHAAWRIADGQLELCNYTRAGFNYPPSLREEDVEDCKRVVRASIGMTVTSAIRKAKKGKTSKGRFVGPAAWPEAELLGSLMPDKNDPWWSTPVGFTAVMLPGDYWNFREHLKGLLPMDKVIVGITEDNEGIRYVSPLSEWPFLSEGTRCLALVVGESQATGHDVALITDLSSELNSAGSAYQAESSTASAGRGARDLGLRWERVPFHRSVCANLMSVAWTHSLPDRPGVVAIRLETDVTPVPLPRRYFVAGYVRTRTTESLVMRARLAGHA